MKKINCIIVFNAEKKNNKQFLIDIRDFLEKKEINNTVYKLTNTSSIECYKKEFHNEIKSTDFVISMGGDGTLLFASRLFSTYSIPIIGTNLGNLGFITEIKKNELKEQLTDFLNDKYEIEKRMMLEARVLRNGKKIAQFTALNDFVVGKNSFAKLSQVEVTVGDTYISTYRADGLLVSTPTGSTAYSLSAGGPIIHPSLHVMIINPICSHSLRVRPLVVSDREVVKLKILTKYNEVMLAADGQQWISLEYEDIIEIKKSRYHANLVKSNKRNFYDVLKNKLHWID